MEFNLSNQDFTFLTNTYMQGAQNKNHASWIKAFQFYNSNNEEKLPMGLDANYTKVLKFCREKAQELNEREKRKWEITCVATGVQSNCIMSPIFNKENKLVAYIFLTADVAHNMQDWDIQVDVVCKKKEAKILSPSNEIVK